MTPRSEALLRKHLKEQLEYCTPEQINFFNRLYKSVEDIPCDRIPMALLQIETTLNKNSTWVAL